MKGEANMNASNDTTRTQTGSSLFTKISLLTAVGTFLMTAGMLAGMAFAPLCLVGMVVYLILSFVLPGKVGEWSIQTNSLLAAVFCFSGGTVLGPIATVAQAEVGTGVVIATLAGCTGVMALCGVIAQLFHWVRFERMAGWLLLAMLGLLAVAIVGIFVTMSSGVNIVVASIGIVVMVLMFLVYFGFAMREAENTYEDALMISIGLISVLVTLIQYVLILLIEIAKNK